MALYRKKGWFFTKNFIIPNKDKTKILFGIQLSIGINADVVQNFNQTANWFFFGFGFNLKEVQLIPFRIDLKWNRKQINFT